MRIRRQVVALIALLSGCVLPVGGPLLVGNKAEETPAPPARGRVVSGQVLDESGRSAPDVPVTAYLADVGGGAYLVSNNAAGLRAPDSPKARTDASGRYTLSLPGTGSYNLEAVQATNRKAWLPRVPGGEAPVMRLVPTGGVKGKVLGVAQAGHIVIFLLGTPYVVVLTADGAFELRDLPAGDFELWVGTVLGNFAALLDGSVHLAPGAMKVVPDLPLPEGAPSPAPSPTPTSPAPTTSPSPEPTQSSSPAPTQSPSAAPTLSPSPAPTQSPSPVPTQSPSPAPTVSPTPTPSPSASPGPATYSTVGTLPLGGSPFSFQNLGGIAVTGDGTLYAADNGAHAIYVFPPGSLTKHNFFWPGDFLSDPETSLIAGLAISKTGHVLAADWGAGVVWDLTPAEGGGATSWQPIFGSLSGSHASPAVRPFAVAVHPDGKTYFVAEGSRQLYLAAGGSASNAFTFSTERAGLAIAPDGRIYTSDPGKHHVWAWNGQEGFGEAGLGSGIGGLLDAEIGFDAKFRGPTAVASDAAGYIYVADSQNNAIRQISPTGTVVTVAGKGIEGAGDTNGSVNSAAFNNPTDVAVAPDGTLYVVDRGNQKIRVITR